MAIPETQLIIWSNSGAAVGSADTYKQIKTVLESTNAAYAGQDFNVFLQGSYGNSTNIYSESDVDVVIELQSAYIFNIDFLPIEQQAVMLQTINGGIIYGVDQFKRHVFDHLKAKFGNDVVMGKRAINIKENSNRRSADVIVCISYKQFTEFTPYSVKSWDGILFKDASGNDIINYPKYHAENCKTKNLSTGGYFKKIVRIFKNMRRRLTNTKHLNEGDAPSYFLEGMLWNVPESSFGRNYQETVANCIYWLSHCDTNQLLCANRMYFLLDPNSSVTWREEQFRKFLIAAINLWNNW